ncbi:MAG: hypothetical protein RIR31_413 [Bacteroidota bacterium]|jgi:hypothetical protein
MYQKIIATSAMMKTKHPKELKQNKVAAKQGDNIADNA